MRSGVNIFIHSLAQRTNQETSTPSKSPPILGDLTRKSQKPTTSCGFLRPVGSKPAELERWYRGTRDEFLLLPPSYSFVFIKIYTVVYHGSSLNRPSVEPAHAREYLSKLTNRNLHCHLCL